VAARRHGARGRCRPLAVLSVAGPRLRLDAEVAQLGRVVGVQHRPVGTRPTQRWVLPVERLVATGKQVQLRVAETRVAVGVGLPVLVAQKPKSAYRTRTMRNISIG